MKKIISILLCFIFIMASVFFHPLEVRGDGGEWRLIDVKNYDGKEYVDVTNKEGVYQASSSAAPGNYTYTWKYLGDTDTYYDPDLLNGENSTSICTFTVPPSTIKGGETVTLSLSLSFGAQMLSYYTDNAGASADFDQWDVEPGNSTRKYTSFKNNDGEDYFKIDTYPTVNILSVSETITATAPMGHEEGGKIALRTIFSGQNQGTSYIYEWYPDESAIATTESSNDNETLDNPEDTLNVEGIEGIEDIEDTENIEDIEDSGKTTQIIDTKASKTHGEASSNVLKVIVTGIVTSVAAAGIGIAAKMKSSSKTNEDGKGNGGSMYKMVVYKDFGDKIKLNADPVYVYARMVEINQEGIEIERLDLTQQINIFSSDGILDIGSPTLAGEYVGASVQYNGATNNVKEEAIVSFRFIGEGGVFQNNMRFKLVGEARIELENTEIFILGGSGRSFELRYSVEDFIMEPTVTIEAVQGNPTFELELGKNKKGEDIIIVKDNGKNKEFESFFNTYMCEIIGENEKEYARNRFYVEVCNEGILPDFLVKSKEIRGYRTSLDSEEMAETIFDVKLGLWNEEKQILEFKKPENIEITLSDDKNIFRLIGTEIKVDENSVLTDRTRYIAKAKTNFPSTKPIIGKMYLLTNYREKTIENEIEISLIPDILQYERNKEKEYEACRRVIEVYMAPTFRGKKLYELERKKHNLGLEDLREFRKSCWAIAERSIMQEGQEYLIEAAWYDEKIAYAELAVYVGDIAFDLALAPLGGPIVGFIASQIKTSFIEICEIYDTNPEKNIGEIAIDFAKKRLEVAAGTADGLIRMPGKDEPKALVAWLISYVIYRIGYHKYYDVDDNNESISIIEAVKRGLTDFVGKGAGVLLGDFIKEQGKGRWVERYSVTDKDEKFVNENMEKALKTTFDVLDEGAAKADKVVDDILDTLLQYINKLKISG